MYQCIRTWFSSAQSSFITKFLVNFCDKICRAHTVLARSKMQEKQNFLKKKFSVSLEKDFIFGFHIYFSGSFASYFLVSDIYTNTLQVLIVSCVLSQSSGYTVLYSLKIVITNTKLLVAIMDLQFIRLTYIDINALQQY